MSVKVDLTLFDEANSLLAPPHPSPLLSALEGIEKAMGAKAAPAPPAKAAPALPAKAGSASAPPANTGSLSLNDELRSLGDLEALKKDVMAIPDDLLALVKGSKEEDIKKHLGEVDDLEKLVRPFQGSELAGEAYRLAANFLELCSRIERIPSGEWDAVLGEFVDPEEEERSRLRSERDSLRADLLSLAGDLFRLKADRAEKVATREVKKGFGEASIEPKTPEEREDAAPPAAPSIEGELSPAEAKEKEDAERTAKAEERGEDPDEKGGDG